MRQLTSSLREGRAKAMTSISVAKGTADYFLQLYDPGAIPERIWSWDIDQLYNNTGHWSPAHVNRFCLEMQVQLSAKLDEGALMLENGVSKSKRYGNGTFMQQLRELRRKVYGHNQKLSEIFDQTRIVMQTIASELEESTMILTYGKMSVDFDEFREYHKVLVSARNLLDADWLNADLTTQLDIL